MAPLRLSIGPSSFCIFAKLIILTPLGCLVGALTGVILDRASRSTTNLYFRALQNMSFPLLFFVIIVRATVAVSISEAERTFDSPSWRLGRANDRGSMVNDFTKRYKVVGMKVDEVQNLLGPTEDVAYPRHPREDRYGCLAYDLGHRTTKYGACFVIYYNQQKVITDFDETIYKWF